ncbi:MAG: FRG domain-containing protein, partial [Candidatus Kariarchaeaceae archaeon]
MRDSYYWQAEAHQRLSRHYNSNQMLFCERKCDNTGDRSTLLIIKADEIDQVIRIVGDLKNFMSSLNVNVLFRGQQNHYNFQQQPAIARTPISGLNFEKQLRLFKFGVLSQGFPSVINEKYSENQFANEAILQHYGFQTRYIDLVDDITTALWFASANMKDHRFSSNPFCYLFIYGVQYDKKVANGVFDGKNQRVVNLREASVP